MLQYLGEYVKAKEYIEKALAINTETTNRLGEATCCESLGTVFQHLGEYVKAKEYLEKALEINIEIGQREPMETWEQFLPMAVKISRLKNITRKHLRSA